MLSTAPGTAAGVQLGGGCGPMAAKGARAPWSRERHLPTPGSYRDLILAQYPALYYRFGEFSGTQAADSSGYGRHGTYAATSSPRSEGALVGDGNGGVDLSSVAGYVTTPYLPWVSGRVISHSMWVKLDTTSGGKMLLGGAHASGYQILGQTSAATSLFYQENSGAVKTTPTGALVLGVWRHVVMILDDVAGQVTWYIDGALFDSQAYTKGFSASNTSMTIGARRNLGTAVGFWAGDIDEVAIFEDALTPAEIKAQYETGIGGVADGGAADHKLSRKPPDTAGYTTRTITEAECARMRGVQWLILNNTTDYIIDCPYVIRHPISIRGGRNIVIQGMHIRIDDQGQIPRGEQTGSLGLRDNGNAADRIIHIEGLLIDGFDVMEGPQPFCPTADVYIGYLRVGSPSQALRVRSSDLTGNIVNSYGDQPYSPRSWQHADVLQTIDYKSLTVERASIWTANSGFNFDSGTSPILLDKVSVGAGRAGMVEEGPYLWGSRFTLGTTQETWDAGVGSWTALGSATVSSNTTTQITGAASLQLSRTGAFRETGAVIAYGSAQDLAGAAGNDTMRLKARLDSGGGGYPMIRIDLATDSAAPANATDCQSDYYSWHHGSPTKLVNGTVVDLVSQFPREVLKAVRKIRILIGKDNTDDTFTVVVDDLATGIGTNDITFQGPVMSAEGSWGLHSSTGAGQIRLSELWMQQMPGNAFVDGVNHLARYWDGSQYVLDPPPGNATRDDFYAGSLMGRVESSDDDGPTVTLTNANVLTAGGDPLPVGREGERNFAPAGIPGVNYVPLGYQATPFPSAAFGVASATLDLTIPDAETEVPCQASDGVGSATLALAATTPVPLDAASGVASATLALTAPAQVPLAASAGVSTATLSLQATTQVPLDAASGIGSATLAVSVQTEVLLDPASGVALASFAITASTQLPLDASSGIASATLALSVTTQLPLDAASGVASTTLVLSAPTTVLLDAASGVSSATLVLAAPTEVPLGASSGVASATLALTAAGTVVLDSSSGIASATLVLTAGTYLSLEASGTSSASLEVTATTEIPFAASAGVGSATLALSAEMVVSLDAASGVSSASVALSAETQVPLDPASGIGAATLDLTAGAGAAQDVPLDPSSGVASASLVLTALTAISLDSSSGVATASLTLNAPAIVSLDAVSGVASATLALSAAARFGPYPEQPLFSSGAATATLEFTVPVVVPLGASTGVASASAALSATTTVSLDASAGTSSASLLVSVPVPVALDSSSGVASATLAFGAFGYGILFDSSAGTSSATLAITAPLGKIRPPTELTLAEQGTSLSLAGADTLAIAAHGSALTLAGGSSLTLTGGSALTVLIAETELSDGEPTLLSIASHSTGLQLTDGGKTLALDPYTRVLSLADNSTTLRLAGGTTLELAPTDTTLITDDREMELSLG